MGAGVARELAERYDSLSLLMKASFEELTAISTIGPKIAAGVVKYFQEPRNRELIFKLEELGVNPKAERQPGCIPDISRENYGSDWYFRIFQPFRG